MTMAEAKARLAAAREGRRRLKVLDAKIEHYRDMAAHATGRMDGMRYDASGPFSALEENVIRLVDLQREAMAERAAYIEHLAWAEEAIRGLANGQQRSVLELRYICGYSWERIAQTLEMDERWVRRLHGMALEKLKNFGLD